MTTNPTVSNIAMRLAMRQVGYNQPVSGVAVAPAVYPTLSVEGAGQLIDSTFQESAAQSIAGGGDRVSLTVPAGYVWVIRFAHFDVQVAGTTTGNAGFTLLSPTGQRIYLEAPFEVANDVRYGHGIQWVPSLILSSGWKLAVDFRTGLGSGGTGRVAAYVDSFQLS